MFTGIVEERGEVRSLAAGEGTARLTVAAPGIAAELRPGESVAVNGACLTVVEAVHDDVDDDGTGRFAADVVAETLARTTLGGLRPGDPVNLERAVTPAGRLGGHLVQGHVDGTGELVHRTGDPAVTARITLPAGLSRYVVAKGSITVDGVSLTVAAVGSDWFEVALIPATLELTTLGGATAGTRMNLEVDVVAKYVERLLDARAGAG